MRLFGVVTVGLFCAALATASRAGGDGDEVVILSVQPRDAAVRPMIMPLPVRPATEDPQARNTFIDRPRPLSEERAGEKAGCVTQQIAL